MSNIYDELDGTQTAKEKKPFDKQAWAQRKQEEKQMAYDMIDNTTNALKKNGQKLIEYLDVQSRMDKYSVANTLLILAQNPNVTQLKDYSGWKEADTGVRNAQTGIIILEPGKEYIKADGSKATSYNTKKVFDISQTHAKDKVRPTTKLDERFIMKALIQNSKVPIKAVDSLSSETMGAFYDHNEKTIFVRRGLDNTDFFTSVSQELAHVELAKVGNYARENCDFKAYCASYMLCKRYGVDTKTFTFERLPQNFSTKDASEVRKVLSDIRSTMTDINDKMSRSFNQNKKPVDKEQER